MPKILPAYLQTLAEHRIDGLHGALQVFRRSILLAGIGTKAAQIACTVTYFDRATQYFRSGSLRGNFYEYSSTPDARDEQALMAVREWVATCNGDINKLHQGVLPPNHQDPALKVPALALNDMDKFWVELLLIQNNQDGINKKKLLSRLLFQFRYPRRVEADGILFRLLEEAVENSDNNTKNALDAIRSGAGWGMFGCYAEEVSILHFGDTFNDEIRIQDKRRFQTRRDRELATQTAGPAKTYWYEFDYEDRHNGRGFFGPCRDLLNKVGVLADLSEEKPDSSIGSNPSRSVVDSGGKTTLQIPLYDYTCYSQGAEEEGASVAAVERKGYGSLRGILTLFGLARESIEDDSNQRKLQLLMAAADALRNRIEILDLDRSLASQIAPGCDLLDHFLTSLGFVQDWEWAVVLAPDGTAQRAFCRKNPEALHRGGGSEPREWRKFSPKQLAAVNTKGNEQIDGRSGDECYWIPEHFNDVSLKWVHSETRRFQWPAEFWTQAFLPSLRIEDRANYEGYRIEYGLPLHAPAPELRSEERKNLEIYFLNLQLDLMRGMIPRYYQRRSSLRNIVGNIMGRNMSHNIGSHVLARYSAEPNSIALIDRFRKQEERTSIPLIRRDVITESGAEDDRDEQTKLQAERVRRDVIRYLQTRMDFIAESSTAESAFEQPLSLFRDAIAEFNEQSLLRFFISGKEGITAEVAVFNDVSCGKSEAFAGDIRFSCPGGAVGVHALFVLLENIIRNCARHSPPGEGVIQLEVSATDCKSADDLIEVRVFDNGTENVAGKMLFDDSGQATGHTGELKDHINQIISNVPLLQSDNSPNTSYWGVREMQICATYLRGVALEDIEVHQRDTDPPILEAILRNVEDSDKRLGYRFFLRKARICAVIVGDEVGDLIDDAQGLDERFCRRDAELRRHGYRLILERDVRSNAAQDRPSAGPAAGILGGYLYAVLTEGCSVQPGVHWPVRTLRCHGQDGLAMAISKLLDLGAHDFLKPVADGSFETELACSWATHELSRTENGAIAIELTEPAELPNYNPLEGDLPSAKVGGLCFFPRVPYAWRHRKGLQDRLTLDSLHELADQNSAALLVWFSHLNTLPSIESLKGLSGFEALFSDLPQQRIWNEFAAAWVKGREFIPREAANLCCMAAALAAGVVILDERVQSEYQKTYRGMRLGLLWELSNVFVPDASYCDLNYPQLSSIQGFLAGIDLKHPHFSRPVKVRYLVIHQTILDSLYTTNKEQVDQWLNNMRGIRLIVCSGRGTPRGHDKFPHSGRFAAYSIIARHLIHQPSKFGLVAGLDASRHPN